VEKNMIKNLKKFRDNKNYSPLKMASLLNITRRTYYNYENGITDPDIKTLINIAEILDVSIDELVGKTSSDSLTLTNKELDILAKSAEVIREIVKKVRK
jgi:transcriptional regulator with XRE-family HTH domain